MNNINKPEMIKYFVFCIFFLFVKVSLFSQTESDKKRIYNEVIEFYYQKYSKDTTKVTLLIDSTTSFNPSQLDLKILMSRKLRQVDNYLISIYKNYFNVDTSNLTNIEIFNHKFQENSNLSESLINYFNENKKIKLIKDSLIWKIFSPFKNITFIDNYSKDHIDSAVKIMNKCWEKLHEDFNCIGYCSISKPYILENNKSAIIYFSYQHYSMVGQSFVFILVKEGNNWIIKEKIFLLTS